MSCLVVLGQGKFVNKDDLVLFGCFLCRVFLFLFSFSSCPLFVEFFVSCRVLRGLMCEQQKFRMELSLHFILEGKHDSSVRMFDVCVLYCCSYYLNIFVL